MDSLSVLASALSLLRQLQDWRRRRRHEFRIVRVQSHKDPELDLVEDIYLNSGLSTNVSDGFDSIRRWTQEIEEGASRLQDYLFVAKLAERSCGFLYAQFYSQSRLVFVSYLVVDPRLHGRARSEVRISHLLASELAKELVRRNDCDGVVFELDPVGREGLSRIFRSIGRRQGIAIKQVKIEYRQPKLSLWEGDYKEERLLLLYGRTKTPTLDDCEVIPQSEAERVVRFLYRDVYGDHFDAIPHRHHEYQKYLAGLYRDVVRDIPEQVPLG